MQPHTSTPPARFPETAGQCQFPDPVAERARFIEAMAKAIDTVTVVTTDGPAGRKGLTVSAFASVSADPPMLLICVNRRNPICEVISQNAVFAVNLLSIDQRHLSSVFAGLEAHGRSYDFNCAAWAHGATGSPLLQDGAAMFDCILESSRDAGTHRIFIGRVVGAEGSERETLLYTRRQYGIAQPVTKQ